MECSIGGDPEHGLLRRRRGVLGSRANPHDAVLTRRLLGNVDARSGLLLELVQRLTAAAKEFANRPLRDLDRALNEAQQIGNGRLRGRNARRRATHGDVPHGTVLRHGNACLRGLLEHAQRNAALAEQRADVATVHMDVLGGLVRVEAFHPRIKLRAAMRALQIWAARSTHFFDGPRTTIARVSPIFGTDTFAPVSRSIVLSVAPAGPRSAPT